jgi:hypothetical protein
MKFEQDVRDNVAEHLEALLADPTNPETFRAVLDKLTRMAILGTAPPSCRNRNVTPSWTYESKLGVAEDDFSARKESFIAP